MKRILFLIFIFGMLFSDSCCDIIKDFLPSQMFFEFDAQTKVATITMIAENDSDVNNPRSFVSEAPIFLYMRYIDDFDVEHEGLVGAGYTNQNGKLVVNLGTEFANSFGANINDGKYSRTFKFIYCPIDCDCISCLNSFGIVLADLGYSTEREIFIDFETHNQDPRYILPSSASFTYTPSSKDQIQALCFPFVLIFALLGAASYISGRNPFSVLDLSTPHMKKHFRYYAGRRGFTLDPVAIVGAGVRTVRYGVEKGVGSEIKSGQDLVTSLKDTFTTKDAWTGKKDVGGLAGVPLIGMAGTVGSAKKGFKGLSQAVKSAKLRADSGQSKSLDSAKGKDSGESGFKARAKMFGLTFAESLATVGSTVADTFLSRLNLRGISIGEGKTLSASEATSAWIGKNTQQDLKSIFENLKSGQVVKVGNFYFERQGAVLVAYNDKNGKEIVALFVDKNKLKDGEFVKIGNYYFSNKGGIIIVHSDKEKAGKPLEGIVAVLMDDGALLVSKSGDKITAIKGTEYYTGEKEKERKLAEKKYKIKLEIPEWVYVDSKGNYFVEYSKGQISGYSTDEKVVAYLDPSKVRDTFNNPFGLLVASQAMLAGSEYEEELKKQTQKSIDAVVAIIESDQNLSQKDKEERKKELQEKLSEGFRVDVGGDTYFVKFETSLDKDKVNIADGFTISQEISVSSPATTRAMGTARMQETGAGQIVLQSVDDLNSLSPDVRKLIVHAINDELRFAENSKLVAMPNISDDKNNKFILFYDKPDKDHETVSYSVGAKEVYGGEAAYEARKESLIKLREQELYIFQLQTLSLSPEAKFAIGLHEDQHVTLNPAEYSNASFLTSDALKYSKSEESIMPKEVSAQPEAYYSVMLSAALSPHNISSESLTAPLPKSFNISDVDKTYAMNMVYNAAVESNKFDLAIEESSVTQPLISGKSKFDSVFLSTYPDFEKQNLDKKRLEAIEYLFTRELRQNETSMVYPISSSIKGEKPDNLKLEEIFASDSPLKNIDSAFRIAHKKDEQEFESALKLNAGQAKQIYDYLLRNSEYKEYVSGRHYPSEGIEKIPTSGAEFKRAYDQFQEASQEFDKKQIDETTLNMARKSFAKAVSQNLPNKVAETFSPENADLLATDTSKVIRKKLVEKQEDFVLQKQDETKTKEKLESYTDTITKEERKQKLDEVAELELEDIEKTLKEEKKAKKKN